MMIFTCPQCGTVQSIDGAVFPIHCHGACEVRAESSDSPSISSGDLPPKPPRPARQRAAGANCKHRGDELRREWCSPCQGWLKVFSCAIHGECMIGKATNGIRSCDGCPDRAESRERRAKSQAPRPSTLAVVTSFFNPHHSRRRVAIYPHFANAIKEQGLPLFCAEGLFPGMQTQVESTWQVPIHAEADMWHKESLLNFAIKHLPDKYDGVVWIDADVIYDETDIGDRILEQLSQYAVVQPWASITYLGPDDQPIADDPPRLSMAAYNRGQPRSTADSRRSFPGMAWAASRELLVRIGGIYDSAITGGGDVVWAAGSVGDEATIDVPNWPASYRQHMLAWMRSLTLATGGRVGMVPANARHLYHGSRRHRQYVSRHAALRRYRFDPDVHLTRDTNGMLRWASAVPAGLRRAVREYIHSRREDD